MANTETSMARVVLLAVSRAAQDVPENCSVDSQKDSSTVAYLKAKSQIAARKIIKAMGSSAEPNTLIPLSAKRSAVPRPVRLPVLSRLIENGFAKSLISKWLDDKSCLIQVSSGLENDAQQTPDVQTQLLDDETRNIIVERAVELEEKDLFLRSSSKILYQNLAGQLLKRQLDELVSEKCLKIEEANKKCSPTATTITNEESILKPSNSSITGETKAGLETLYGLIAKSESKPPSEPTDHKSQSGFQKMHRPSPNPLSKRERLRKSVEPSQEQTAKVESHVQKFIERYLDPMLGAGIISQAVFAEVVSKTTKKVMGRHKKCCTADFLLDEGDKIKNLAKEYVRHIRCRIGDVQN